MLIVIDTNVLVSALWSKNSNPARLLYLVFEGTLKPCYDYRILEEYQEVLKRPKFKFSESDIQNLLEGIKSMGMSVISEPISARFEDEEDKKFYEVAKFCNAKLITGNLKHFPKENYIMSVSEFLESLN